MSDIDPDRHPALVFEDRQVELASRSGSARMSISTIFPRLTVNAPTVNGLPSRSVTAPGEPLINAGRITAFYGAANDGLIEPVRKRQFPIVGDGHGIFPFIHLDDAAAATVRALDHDGPAIYNVVDDEPAPVREWLPVLAQALGAKPPRHFPAWLARLVAGEAAVVMGTEARGASNAKAKRELGLSLRYPSWRQGFPAAYAAIRVT